MDKMGNRDQNDKYFMIEEISAEFPASISTRGDSYYLRLDPRVVRFWKLKSGDFLDIRLIKVRRLKKEGR